MINKRRKKYSYEEVKDFIENKSNCILLSKTYHNCKEKLDIQCRCGNKFKTSFDEFKNAGTRQCKNCANSQRAKNNLKWSIYKINNWLKENKEDYICKSTTYINSHDKLIFVCNNKHKFLMSWSSFYSSGHRCPYCAHNMHLNGGDIYNEFIKRNYKPLFNSYEYKNNAQKLPYICLKHKDKGTQYISYSHFAEGKGCRYCGREKNKGSNHWNWQGGITIISAYLRQCDLMIEWKNNSFKIADYNCVLTKYLNRDLVIHHLYPFANIRDEVLQNYNLIFNNYINNCDNKTLKEIETKFSENQNKYGLGICLHKDIHDLFHKIYNTHNNTPEQFVEFVRRLENHEFDTYLQNHNLKLNINYDILNKLLNQFGLEYNN